MHCLQASQPGLSLLLTGMHRRSRVLRSPCFTQDLLALSPAFCRRPADEETINDPTNPRHYWRYRLHVGLEDLLDDSSYLEKLQALLLGAFALHTNLQTLFCFSTWSFLKKTHGKLACDQLRKCGHKSFLLQAVDGRLRRMFLPFSMALDR